MRLRLIESGPPIEFAQPLNQARCILPIRRYGCPQPKDDGSAVSIPRGNVTSRLYAVCVTTGTFSRLSTLTLPHQG